MFKLIVFFVVFCVASADVKFLRNNQEPYFKILRQEQDIDPSGSYRWSYETENGIAAQESGQLQLSRASQQLGTAAQGSYSYTSPEGIPVFISYIADENGFQPQGDVLPTQPPTTPIDIKSLNYGKAHPQQPERRKFGF